MVRQVTAGIDSSEESVAAGHWAAREAVLRGARLLLVHVEEWPLPLAVAAPTIVRDDHRHWADRMLEEVAGELRRAHPDADLATRRLSGRAAAALPVEAADAELLVLGSRGLGTVAGALMGSVGMGVIAATTTPVVLVRAGGREAAGGVVVGVDPHDDPGQVLDFGFAAALRGGRALHAVHAARIARFHAHSPAHRAAAERRAAEELAGVLDPWRRGYPTVPVVERAVEGSPGQALVEEAADASLVVVGRRVRRAPVVPHIGPVTHAAIHHCAAPVAVVAHG